jgi:5'-nucleotidase / UDP-sugar diphosphatase
MLFLHTNYIKIRFSFKLGAAVRFVNLFLILLLSVSASPSLAASSTASSNANSTVIQILHTNDLHAAMNTAGAPKPAAPALGGWAQIKTLMDQWTAAAKSQGIETIRLDAGDFLEGTNLYFADGGANVLRAYQQLGFDASALGNHDWLMGARGLNDLLGVAPFSHALLSANIKVHPRLQHLKTQLKPATIIERAGVKIGIVGLSTTEAFYKWIPRVGSRKSDMKLKNYWDSTIERDDDGDGETEIEPGIANRLFDHLAPKTDAVIALTHIGYGSDQELVHESKNLDLVVGGHSHTFLETLSVAENRDGREIPIVQTGYNGRSIGRVLLEVTPGQPARVLSTELIPVPLETEQDPTIAKAVAQANQAYESLYGAEVLNEKLGTSKVRLVPGRTGPTSFSQFAVEAIRKSIDAEVAIDIGAFHGNSPIEGGVITRRKLMEMYPRKFEADQNEGLYVYRARIPGLAISLGVKFAVKYGLFVSLGGVDYEVEKLSDAEYNLEKAKLPASDRESLTQFRAKNITINGNRICALCFYDAAVPESLLRGAYGISPLTRLVIRHGHRTDQTIWKAMEAHLKDIGTIGVVSDDARFSPRRFSRKYQQDFDGHIDPDQSHEEEYPEHHGDDDTGHDHHEIPFETLLNRFLDEYQRASASSSAAPQP